MLTRTADAHMCTGMLMLTRTADAHMCTGMLMLTRTARSNLPVAPSVKCQGQKLSKRDSLHWTLRLTKTLEYRQPTATVSLFGLMARQRPSKFGESKFPVASSAAPC
eukprot:317622-Pelagomonas_calceolata.AAC.4